MIEQKESLWGVLTAVWLAGVIGLGLPALFRRLARCRPPEPPPENKPCDAP